MKVQVPGEEIIEANRLLTLDVDPTPIAKKPYHKGFRDAIDYCNEQLATPPTKRPFLSDNDIANKVNSLPNMTNHYCIEWSEGARWARDKYEAAFVADVPNVEPKWQPVVGQWVKGWDGEGSDSEPVVGEFSGRSSQLYLILREGKVYQRSFCAALETIDEIGKPPQYFIERGRATV